MDSARPKLVITKEAAACSVLSLFKKILGGCMYLKSKKNILKALMERVERYKYQENFKEVKDI